MTEAGAVPWLYAQRNVLPAIDRLLATNVLSKNDNKIVCARGRVLSHNRQPTQSMAPSRLKGPVLGGFLERQAPPSNLPLTCLRREHNLHAAMRPRDIHGARGTDQANLG